MMIGTITMPKFSLRVNLEKVYTYLKTNHLVLNLKERKTETMLFGTPVGLTKQTKKEFLSCD